MAQTVVFHILLNNKGYGKHSLLSGLLFDDGEPVSVPVPDNITGTEAQNIADTQAEIPFQYKGGGGALVRPEAAKALLHGGNDLGILLCGKSGGFLIHSITSLIVRIDAGEKFVF